MSTITEDRTDEDGRVWAESTKPGTFLLDKGEQVVSPRTLTPEEKAEFEQLIQNFERAQSDG